MKTILNRWTAACHGGLVVLLTLALAACGGGGVIPSPGVSLRALDTDFTSRKAVAYSPYRTSTNEAGLAAESIPLGNIKQDLQLLQRAGFGVVRLFDSSDKVAAQTIQAIRELNLDMKVMLGVWINTSSGTNAAANSAANDAEIARAVTLANANPQVVKAISVGNETLVSWNTWNPQTTQVMADYLRNIRSRVSQPVTTDDNWAFFAYRNGEQNPDPVLNQIDFVSMHTYPFIDAKYSLWDWQQSQAGAGSARVTAMMDAAIAKAKADYQAVRSHLDGYGYASMPIVVGETGWKAMVSDGGSEAMRASPVNQKMYHDRLLAWKQEQGAPKTIVYFSAFDETWKQTDDKWGMFNAQRQARCTALSVDNTLQAEGGSCAISDAVSYTSANNQGTVTANQYTVYAQQSTVGEALPSSSVALNAWQNGTTANALEVSESSGDGNLSMRVTPVPLSWGWGMTWGLAGNAEVDFSNFSGGHLQFSIKTTYAGKLEVGFLTGSANDGTAYDVYIPISSGQYGHLNDGQWHTVSIPIADIVAHGAPAYGMSAPTSRLLLNRVSNMLVLADRYSYTQNSANVTTPIWVDNIRWTR
jgi:Glycosyl hydrolases family 17